MRTISDIVKHYPKNHISVISNEIEKERRRKEKEVRKVEKKKVKGE